MAEASIPVDLLNPGQVFACLGFLEAAEILSGNARGGFDWSNEADIRFRLSASGQCSPVVRVLEFLANSKISCITWSNSGIENSNWGIETIELEADAPFPVPPPDKSPGLPFDLQANDEEPRIQINHFGDTFGRSGRDGTKFWAGMKGKPGAKVAAEALSSVAEQVVASHEHPFDLTAPQSSSFRFDWRRDYIPLDIGFSLNNHKGRITTVGYPLVEVLAAIGLSNARPEFHDKLTYRYGVLGTGRDGALFEPFFLRASLGAPELPFSQRTFCMNLGWPGKEGQARCITNVYEETNND